MSTTGYGTSTTRANDPTRAAAQIIAKQRGHKWGSLSAGERQSLLKEVRMFARALQRAGHASAT